MVGEKKNIFISHVHEDDEVVGKLKELLGKHDYEIRDSSITSDNPNAAKNPQYIKSEVLAPRIDWAGTMLVLISEDTHMSEWVNWEIEYAHEHDTRIVGVWCRGSKDSDLPEAFEDFGDDLVGWDGGNIIDAIEGEEHWESPEGTPRPKQKTPRKNC